MSQNARKFYARLSDRMKTLGVTDDKGNEIDFFSTVETVSKLALERTKAGSKLMFIGNGGSAAISSHMATDYLKNGGMRALSFNDGSLLTCLSNDLGYEHVFEKPIEMLAQKGDVLIAISSSGQSENILKGVRAARKMGVHVVTLSGFSPDNPLRRMGDLNFYVSDGSYGAVEILHHSICHSILDVAIMVQDEMAG